MKSEKGSLTVGIAAASYPTAQKLFDAVGIDYAMHGNLTISEAAELEGLDPNGLVEAVAEIVRRSTPLWLDKSPDEMIAFVEKHHHALSRELVFRTQLRLAEAYGGSDIEEAHNLRIAFTSFAGDLLAHIEYEELVAFPLLAKSTDAGRLNDADDVVRLKRAIQKLLLDHSRLSEAAHRLTSLCNRLEATQSSARAHPDVLRSVRAVEKHLRHYMGLENNVLFPRGLETRNTDATPTLEKDATSETSRAEPMRTSLVESRIASAV